MANANTVSNRLNQDAESIDAEAVQSDTQAAVEMLQTVQSQLEDVRPPLTSPFMHLSHMNR